MKHKGIKTLIVAGVAILSLSSTAYAGFKAFTNKVGNDSKSHEPKPSATPEIIERIEEIEEITIVGAANPSASPTAIATPTPNPSTTLSTPKPSRFTDDDDDEVEFEDRDNEKDDDKEKEEDHAEND